jgi:hypothetical protein
MWKSENPKEDHQETKGSNTVSRLCQTLHHMITAHSLFARYLESHCCCKKKHMYTCIISYKRMRQHMYLGVLEQKIKPNITYTQIKMKLLNYSSNL